MSGSGSGSAMNDLVFTDLINETMVNLSFSPVMFGDEGVYRCTVTNTGEGITESEPANVTGGCADKNY